MILKFVRNQKHFEIRSICNCLSLCKCRILPWKLLTHGLVTYMSACSGWGNKNQKNMSTTRTPLHLSCGLFSRCVEGEISNVSMLSWFLFEGKLRDKGTLSLLRKQSLLKDNKINLGLLGDDVVSSPIAHEQRLNFRHRISESRSTTSTTGLSKIYDTIWTNIAPQLFFKVRCQPFFKVTLYKWV